MTLPLLLLLAFGCADFGRALAMYIAISNAARTGAEYAATHGFSEHSEDSWTAEIKGAVKEELVGTPSFRSDNLSITVTTTPGEDDLDEITVSASYPFQTITAWPGLPQDVVLQRSVSMQRFR